MSEQGHETWELLDRINKEIVYRCSLGHTTAAVSGPFHGAALVKVRTELKAKGYVATLKEFPGSMRNSILNINWGAIDDGT